MKAPLILAFLCILALCYLAFAQQQELVRLGEDVEDFRLTLRNLEPKPPTPKPARAPRTPAKKKEPAK